MIGPRCFCKSVCGSAFIALSSNKFTALAKLTALLLSLLLSLIGHSNILIGSKTLQNHKRYIDVFQPFLWTYCSYSTLKSSLQDVDEEEIPDSEEEVSEESLHWDPVNFQEMLLLIDFWSTFVVGND